MPLGVPPIAAQGALTEQRLAREHAAREAQHARELANEAMEANSQQSMAALEASAKQSRAALDANIEQNRLDQRAWVGTTAAVGGSLDSKDPFPKFRVIITNTGKTPAIFVESKVMTTTAVKPFTDNPPAFMYSALNSKTGAIQLGAIMPSATIGMIHTAGLGEGYATKIETGQMGLFLQGTIWYKDIFNREHWTKYCYSFEYAVNGFGACSKQDENNAQ